MKKLILITHLLFASFALLAQQGSASYSVLRQKLTATSGDTTSSAFNTAVSNAVASGYAVQFWNNIATTPHYDFINSEGTQHVFTFGGSASGAFLPLTLTSQTEVDGAQNLWFGQTTPLAEYRMSVNGTVDMDADLWEITSNDGGAINFTVDGPWNVTTQGDAHITAIDTFQITAAFWRLNGDAPTTGQVPTAQGDGTVIFADPAGGGGGSVNTLAPNIQTGSTYTVAATDTTNIIYMRHASTPQTVTIPSGLKVGSVFTIAQDSTATTSIACSGCDLIGTNTLSAKEVSVWHHRETGKYVRLGSATPYEETIQIVIDGGGTVISTGLKGFVEVKTAGTITGWTIVGDVSGSIVVDVWKDTYANYPPVVGDAIAGTEKPTISSAVKGQDLSLSTWSTTTITKGDWIGFNVDSATTVTRVTLSIRYTRN